MTLTLIITGLALLAVAVSVGRRHWCTRLKDNPFVFVFLLVVSVGAGVAFALAMGGVR
jgi:hypothetical protein